MKIVINTCFGGFRISDVGHQKLIEWGVPVRAYVEQKRDPATNRYLPEPLNEGKVIFDRNLDPEADESVKSLCGRYWTTWLRDDSSRSHPLLVRLVEEMGAAASDSLASLKVVEIPDGTNFVIEEYDGRETVAEAHQTWN